MAQRMSVGYLPLSPISRYRHLVRFVEQAAQQSGEAALFVGKCVN